GRGPGLGARPDERGRQGRRRGARGALHGGAEAAADGRTALSGSRPSSRSVARLAAVQALYQMEVSSAGAEHVIREFTEHRFDRDIEGVTLAAADESFFADLVRGVVADQVGVDAAIARHLAQGWRLERLDATVRAILRAGAFELAKRLDVPTE